MTKDADVWLLTIQKSPPVFCELSAFIHDMTDGDAEAGQFDHGLWWKPSLFVRIDIAGDGRHGSNGLKLLNDVSLANITGVENMIHVFKMQQNRRVE